MKPKMYAVFSAFAALALFASACAGASQPTPDVAAISTAAAQTVEARFTEQAAAQPATPTTPVETPTPQATPTLGYPPTPTTQPGQPTPTSNGKACYTATFIADVTIPDGKIIAPDTKFTKTWRIRNDGNCVWDSTYSLILAQGDAMGSPAKVALASSVSPGQSVDLSLYMTAPTVKGAYSGYWRIATPFGGSFGIGSYDQSLIVKINVSTDPVQDFDSVSVVYDMTRKPQTGCSDKGASYSFSAVITVNAAGDINYRWDRNPSDGTTEGGRLRFSEAGSKTVYFTWNLQPDAIQNIDRWVAVTTIIGSREKIFDKVTFNFTCNP
jgi:hypothetical protein